MDTYTLQRIIADHNSLSSTEKLVGLMLSLHLAKKSDEIRIKQQTIAQKCSLSERAVRNAIKALIEKGVFSRKRTFRVDVLGLGESLERIRGIYGAASGAGCKRNVVPVVQKKDRLPWEYETDFSERFEEVSKREDAQLARELATRG